MSRLFELEGLNEIDWSALDHAYGKASDTPAAIRALASPDPRTRSAALMTLEASTCHQGSIYSATAATIPFLLTAAERLNSDALKETTTEFGGDLLGLIQFIIASCTVHPGAEAELAHSRWKTMRKYSPQPDPRTIALEETDVAMAVCQTLIGNSDRLLALFPTKGPEIIEDLSRSESLGWAGDLFDFVHSRPVFSAGVATAVFAEPVSLSYKKLAHTLDPEALSGTLIWWALERELEKDPNPLWRDSLARDINEHVRHGWKTGMHHERQTERFWEQWSLRFHQHPERVTKVRQFLDQNAVPGWLPQSCDNPLVVEAVIHGLA